MKMSQTSTFHLSFSIFNSLLLLLILFTIGCSRGCVERERLALLDFKKIFNNYEKLSSWNSSEDAKDCCSWEGIICDDPTGHVVDLNLFGEGLKSYQLRPSLLELQHLTGLDLGRNNLTMRIPEFIGSFSKLRSLGLHEAGFFGIIPPQLGNLSNIQSLDLGGSKLSIDNFQWLSRLSSLDSLDIDSINFSEARDWLFVIRKLPLLSSFSCYSCYFPTPDLPSIFSNHSNCSSSLQRLYLSDSVLSSSTMSLLINSTYNLSELVIQSLNLDDQFPNIFDQIGNHCNLKALALYACSIQNRILDILQALAGCASDSLESLTLGSNNLTGIIPPMLKFSSLRNLELDDNHLESFASHNSGFFPKPQDSYISSRNFIDTTLLNTRHLFPATLSTLSISGNNLHGVLLDAYFANLSQLSLLDLTDNPNLTISFIESPSEIEEIHLSSCNLGPNFPTWLLSLKSIVYLDISKTNIFGSLPIIFWRNLPPTLEYFNLSSNNLHGILPNLPFQFNSEGSMYATIIDLSWNSFYGPVPFCFFKATVLHFSNNNFSSFAPLPYSTKFPLPIPNVDSDTYMLMLDFSENNLSGEIPHLVWLAVSRFNTVNLANNNLSGKVPSSLEYTTNLIVLNLSNNSFFGPLPSFLKNCTNMRILDLSRNKFSGFIPSWLGEGLKRLAVFSLESNNFSGTLPINLCLLSSLQILDFSYNKLSGIIPSCVYNFAAMAHDVNLSSEVWVPMGMYDNPQLPIEEAVFYQALIKWKGMDRLFKKNLELVRLMDLSNNNLSGEIPTELMSLLKLNSLDLSSNNFHGSIPNQIGQLKSLEYLNLSFNKISGQIPSSFSNIYSLGMLDLSHNNLLGRIPKGTQLQGFNSSAFSSNSELCGSPLQVKCPGDVDNSAQALQPSSAYDSEMEDKRDEKQCFYAGLGAGFACGFFGILGTLIWIRKWRYAFFHFSTEFGEWILLAVALTASKISRKFRFK